MREPLTSELLEQLLQATSPEAYLSQAPLADASLADYLGKLRAEKGLSRADAIRASGLNTTYAYQIFAGARNPDRDHTIMLAFGLGCTLTEAQRMLRYAGVSELWCKLRRDAVIIYCLEHGFSRAETDDELFRLGERTLLEGES